MSNSKKRVSRIVDLDIGLPKEINECHRLAMASATKAVEYAIRCGELLAKQKAALSHGEFIPWVEKNCDFSYKTGQRYMVAARESATGVSISAIRHLYPSGRPGAKPQKTPEIAAATPAPPRPALAKPVAVVAEMKAAPATDEPERPDWEPDEDEKNDAIEREVAASVEKVMAADDKLAAAYSEIKRQAAEIAVLKLSRDGYMNGKSAMTKLLKAEQRKTDRLTRDLDRLRKEAA